MATVASKPIISKKVNKSTSYAHAVLNKIRIPETNGIIEKENYHSNTEMNNNDFVKTNKCSAVEAIQKANSVATRTVTVEKTIPKTTVSMSKTLPVDEAVRTGYRGNFKATSLTNKSNSNKTYKNKKLSSSSTTVNGKPSMGNRSPLSDGVSSSSTTNDDSKKVFIAAPIPKVNAWRLNNNCTTTTATSTSTTANHSTTDTATFDVNNQSTVTSITITDKAVLDKDSIVTQQENKTNQDDEFLQISVSQSSTTSTNDAHVKITDVSAIPQIVTGDTEANSINKQRKESKNTTVDKGDRNSPRAPVTTATASAVTTSINSRLRNNKGYRKKPARRRLQYIDYTDYLADGPQFVLQRVHPGALLKTYFVPVVRTVRCTTPTTTIPFILECIQNQVEYYLSTENLNRDFFIRRKMDKDGYLPIALIASFNRIQSYTEDEVIIVDAIKNSDKLELSSNGKMVRPRDNPLQWLLPETINLCTTATSLTALLPPPPIPSTKLTILNPNVPEFVPFGKYKNAVRIEETEIKANSCTEIKQSDTIVMSCNKQPIANEEWRAEHTYDRFNDGNSTTQKNFTNDSNPGLRMRTITEN